MARLLLLGDTHITDKKPERRKEASNEEYFKTFLGKLSQVSEIYYAKNCDCLIQVGDFFDSYSVSKEVIAEMIEFLRLLKMNIYCIWGQHDISGHSHTTYKNSPLRVLESAGVVNVLQNSCLLNKDSVVLYGCPFGQNVVNPSDTNSYNILITHQMIGDQPLYPGHQIKQPSVFLKEHPEYALIVCGDYHYRFIEDNNGRYCINPGALIRKTINQRDLELQPGIVYFETNTNYYEVIKLNAAPPEDIFDFAENEIKKERDLSILDNFLHNLSLTEGTKIGWKELLHKVMKKKKTNKEVREVIENSILEVSKKK